MWRLFFLIAAVSAQIPSLGFCPDYQPMANFNMNRFLGTWYEAERYFTISELGSRCVTTKYESTPEGRILVSNEITNAMTGMKRVLEGHLQMIGREGEGRMIVKYATLPVPYDTEFSVLDTDYDTYAVMWSCSGIGPVHIQNAWVLTRDRLAPPMTMQKAYAALETFKVSRTFFVKTNQEDCYILPDPAAYSEYKEVDVSGKHASMVPPPATPETKPVVENKVEPEVKSEVPEVKSTIPEVESSIPEVKSAIPEVKSAIPEVKSAIPEISEEPKPVPEVKSAETMAKDEKTEMPEQTTEIKKDMPEPKEDAAKEKDLPVKPIQ